MKIRCLAFAFAMMSLSFPLAATEPLEFVFDFSDDTHGFAAGFADYPAGEEEFYELKASYSLLPNELNDHGRAIYLHGSNRSDDLYMYLKKQIEVEANTTYRLNFDILFASNVPQGCVGIGGSPGESVLIKAGASIDDPQGKTTENGYVRMNIKKGNQISDGIHASGISYVHNGKPCEDKNSKKYGWVHVNRDHLTPAKADENGKLWLNIGIDSGFEGKTGLYFREIKVVLTKVATSSH